MRGFPWTVPTCCAPGPPTKEAGEGSSAASGQVPPLALPPPAAGRRRRPGRPGAGGLPCRKAGPPPPPGRAGSQPRLRRHRPGNKARPSRRACAAPGAAGPTPRRGWGEGRAPPDAATHPAAALRVPGAGRRPAVGRADAGRSRDPPAPAGLWLRLRLPSAASYRLAGPAAVPRGRGRGGRLRPLPRRQGDGEHRTLPRPPPLRRPRFSNPPPARGARSRDTARPCRGAAAAAARDPARPSDGGAKPHPAGRQCAAAAPLGGCRALRPAGLGPRPRPGLLSGAGGPLRVPRGARGGCGAPGAGGPGEVAVVAPRSLEVHVRECGPNASHLDHRRKPVAQRGPQADVGSHPRPFAIRVSVLAAPARVLFPPIGCPGSWTNILKPLSRQD